MTVFVLGSINLDAVARVDDLPRPAHAALGFDRLGAPDVEALTSTSRRGWLAILVQLLEAAQGHVVFIRPLQHLKLLLRNQAIGHHPPRRVDVDEAVVLDVEHHRFPQPVDQAADPGGKSGGRRPLAGGKQHGGWKRELPQDLDLIQSLPESGTE